MLFSKKEFQMIEETDSEEDDEIEESSLGSDSD